MKFTLRDDVGESLEGSAATGSAAETLLLEQPDDDGPITCTVTQSLEARSKEWRRRTGQQRTLH